MDCVPDTWMGYDLGKILRWMDGLCTRYMDGIRFGEDTPMDGLCTRYMDGIRFGGYSPRERWTVYQIHGWDTIWGRYSDGWMDCVPDTWMGYDLGKILRWMDCVPDTWMGYDLGDIVRGRDGLCTRYMDGIRFGEDTPMDGWTVYQIHGWDTIWGRYSDGWTVYQIHGWDTI